MRLLIPFIVIFAFFACYSDNNLDEKKIQFPFSMENNEGIWYFLEDKSKNRAYLSLEKIDDVNYTTNVILPDSYEAYLVGILSDNNQTFSLNDLNSYEQVIAHLEFDSDNKPQLELEFKDKNISIEYKLSENKINTLNFAKNMLQESLKVGLNFTVTMVDDAFLIPSNIGIEEKVLKNINEKIGYGAKSTKELKEILKQEQKKRIEKQENFSLYIEYINSLMPDYIDDKILSFKDFRYEYIDIYEKNKTYSRIFSLETGEELSSKTKDLIKNINDNKLLEITYRKLKNAAETGLLSRSDYKYIPLPEEFFISKDGIEFIWYHDNYRMEKVNFRFSELKPYVKEDSKLYYLFDK